jgi:hypothetical protein
MKPIALIAVAATLVGSAAYAQNREISVAPSVDRSTGPTIPDARSVDQIPPLPSSGGMTSPKPTDSNAFNADPKNPSGLPGPSTGLGTSPTR